MNAALKDASRKRVAKQALPVHNIEAEPKVGPEEIKTYVAKGIEGLTFKLGSGYDGSIISQYLSELNKVPFFHYISIVNTDDSLFGMIGSRQLTTLIREHEYLSSENDFAGYLTNKNTDKLGALPRFVTADLALTNSSTSLQALQAMQEHDVDWFPVVDQKHHLSGVVERSALAANLLVDVVDQL